MKMILKQLASHKFVVFVFCAGISALGNLSARIYFGLFVSYPMSVFLAYFVGLLISYTLYRTYVFQSKNAIHKKEIAWFITINLLALAITFSVSVILEQHLLRFISNVFLREELAHIVGIICPAFTSYFGHKNFSFRK